MKYVNIGFDIGITSVGWAIVDEENQIIARGVRLFEELKNPKDGKLKNQQRRAKRSLRRTIRRKINRKSDFVKLVINKYQSIFQIQTKEEFLNCINQIQVSVVELRKKAISGKIEKNELLKVLYFFLAHRGYTYLTLEKLEENELILEKANKNNLEKLFKWLNDNKDLSKEEKHLEAEKYNLNKDFKTSNQVIKAAYLHDYNKSKEGKFPCEVQYDEFEEDGHYKGLEINASFSIHDYKKEITKIIDNQSYLTESFKNDYYLDDQSVFSRIRPYSQGPGGIKSPSEYGLYQRDEKTGTIIKTSQNLWDKLVGKCSVYIEEDRAMKRSVSGEISNFLSQLNIMKIDSNHNSNSVKLSQDQKRKIFDSILSGTKFNDTSIKKIAKVIPCEPSIISSYPTDQDGKNVGKEAFDKMENTKKLFNLLNQIMDLSSLEKLLKKIDLLNDILKIFSIYKDDVDGQKEYLKKLSQNNQNILDHEIIEKLIRAKFQTSETHSLSYKALEEHINDEIITNGQTVNQKFKKIIDNNQINKFKFGDSKYMNPKCLDEEVMSPTTKCSFRETVKVFNKILKLFVYKDKFKIKNIVIEMPTVWNSVDERKLISDIQKNNETNKKLAKEHYGYDGNDKNIISKLHLLWSQDGKDVYDGEPLDQNQVITNPNYTEIDHIIPYSISYDNSFSNKVLTKKHHNSNKGKTIPFTYIGSGKFFALKNGLWTQLYKENANKINNSPRKFDFLTIQDISRRELGFIGRNLSDTQYASRLANQAFHAWIDVKLKADNHNLTNKVDDEINIISINGRTSQTYRYEKYLDIGKKNRDENYHHAVDATICAILGNANNTIGKLVWSKTVITNHDTGEITYQYQSKYVHENKISFNNDDIKWKDLSNNVARTDDIKFSYKMTKKLNNFGFWGDTILSIQKKDEDFYRKKYIEPLKYENYSDAEKAINRLKKEYIDAKGKNLYHDPNILNDILKIWNEFSEKCKIDINLSKKNPFKIYMEEVARDFSKEITRPNKPRLYINRNGYEYYVNSLYVQEKINSFFPINKNDDSGRFGGYTSFEWKEIRIYKDNKNKYRVISVSKDLLKIDKLSKKFIIDEEKMSKELREYNIDESHINNFILVHKGSCFVKKDDSSIIMRVCGIDQIQNRIDIKNLKISKNIRKQTSINTIMEDYDISHIDELGNIKKVNF